MKISYNWLNQYHDLSLSPDKVAEMLTGCGLEVEGQELFQSIKGGLKGVVIGEVLTCEKHPNSDHLSLTTVNIGAPEPLKIVCGASNVAQGQKVAVATIGTTLFFKDEALTLQRTKIRGEVSEGMICAEDELGLGSSHAGILVLDADAVPGTSAGAYYKVEEDITYTIGLTPNRADAASHLGVARDLVAVFNNFGGNREETGNGKSLIIPDVSSFAVDSDNLHIDVVIDDDAACPRYSGITLSGVTVTDSPEWLKNRLLAIGLRPINNIVDITNYILMELGQPLHAFDADCITGNRVVVKKYPAGTKFVTLDTIERELSANDLMICNTAEPMCIAGVFGGSKSGVTGKTSRIFIESACFDPKHIRRSSRFHGLQTDASFRFERGTNYDITVYALKRAAMMIKEIAGGMITSEIVDVYPNPFPPVIVELSYKRLDRLIGKTIGRETVKSILADLGIAILAELTDDPGLRLQIPGFKVDVTREADVAEEILRVYGYNNIVLDNVLRSSLSFTHGTDPEKVQNLVADYLAAGGFSEIMNNSLTRSTYYEGNPDFHAEHCVRMLNPISRELDVMRQTLLFGMAETIVHNQNRKSSDLKLFEFGRVYSIPGEKNDPVQGYHEEKHLAIAMTGRLRPENWNSTDKPVDFYELKGFLGSIFKKLSVAEDKLKIELFASGYLTGGQVCSAGPGIVYRMGLLSAPVLKMFDIRQPVFYAELNWDKVLALIPAANAGYTELPKFPEVRRDLALLIDRTTTFAEIEQLAYQTEKKLLKKVGLFDVYEGDKIGPGKKSYAVKFILQDSEKTLTDKEIEKVMERMTRAFASQLNAQLR